jgi:hypothetical protein
MRSLAGSFAAGCCGAELPVGCGEVVAELLVFGAQLGDLLVGQFQAAAQRLAAGPAAGLAGRETAGCVPALHLLDLVT